MARARRSRFCNAPHSTPLDQRARPYTLVKIKRGGFGAAPLRFLCFFSFAATATVGSVALIHRHDCHTAFADLAALGPRCVSKTDLMRVRAFLFGFAATGPA